MDENQKMFSLFVFMSSFARNLIELFIPVILFQFGFSLKEVIFYYLYVNVFSLLLSYPCFCISTKYNNKLLLIIGVASFVLLQILLNYLVYNTLFLMLIAFLYALYRRGYWISRRFYNLKVMKKQDVSSTYSIISIISQLGVVFSSYVGSLFLDYVSVKIVTVFAIVLFLISVIPLNKLKFEHKENGVSINFFETFKKIPKRDIYLFGTYELIAVIKFLFPLYLFMYVKDTYQTVGILNLLANIATIMCAYIYGKIINKENNFLRLSILLVIFVYLLKLSVPECGLIIVAFLEGIFIKINEISVQKEFYILSKKFEYQNYNFIYELAQNLFRTIITGILFFYVSDVKIMIFIVLIAILTGAFVKFKKIDIVDYKA